jgi:hypothetical protein
MTTFEGEPVMGDITRRVVSSLKVTAGYAAVYFVLDLLKVGLGGREVLHRWHMTLPTMIAFYGFAVITVGAIGGLLLPLARYTWGAASVGFLALLPMSYLGFDIVLPASASISARLVLTVLFSGVYGILGGLYLLRGGAAFPVSAGAEGGGGHRIWWYIAALIGAIMFLWADLRFHLVNK